MEIWLKGRLFRKNISQIQSNPIPAAAKKMGENEKNY